MNQWIRAIIATCIAGFATLSLGLDATITKITDANHQLKQVAIVTPGVTFYVSAYGSLDKVTKNNVNNDTPNANNEPLQVTYYSSTTFNNNQGRVAAVNGIRIIYYPPDGLTPQVLPNTLGGNSVPTPLNYQNPTNNNVTQQITPPTSNNSNVGKVRMIGDLSFSYYDYNDPSGNGGKLNRVGTNWFRYSTNGQVIDYNNQNN